MTYGIPTADRDGFKVGEAYSITGVISGGSSRRYELEESNVWFLEDEELLVVSEHVVKAILSAMSSLIFKLRIEHD